MFSDWKVRQEFYWDNGFDQFLTALPEPVFTDSLYETGILYPALFPPTPPPFEPSETEESGDVEVWARRRGMDAYDFFFSLETQLRHSIHRVMTTRYGPKWEKLCVPDKLRQEWESKRRDAVSKGQEAQPLLWYADFTDYIDIIVQGNNWREIFKPVFLNETDIRASFQRLHPIRNATMHIRLVTEEDILLLTVEYRRILKAIDRFDED